MLTLPQALALLNDKSRALPTQVKRWRDVYHGISLHTTGAAPRFSNAGSGWIEPPNYFGEEYQKLFDTLLLNRHPRESELTRNWRYSQYRPFTKDPFIRIMEVVKGAIFQDTNYSVEVNQKDDSEYAWGNNFNGNDIVRYFAWALQHIFEDPNGHFVRIPKEPGYATTTARVEPDVWFVGSKNIIEVNGEEIIFMREGFAWLVNKLAIFRFKKIKDVKTQADTWVNADADGYYAHLLGYLPADIAGGQWNTQGFYNSWLDKAKAVADDFISNKSAEQLVKKEASHPFIVAAQEKCPTCEGVGRVQVDCEACIDGVELVSCRKCHGTGNISRNPGEWLTAPAEEMDKELIKIINPSVEVLKAHTEGNTEAFAAILDALHLLRVDEAQSGTAKSIDQERLYQFVSEISNDLFDRLMTNTLRDIISYRNVIAVDGVTRPAAQGYVIVKPTQFQIKTASDLLLEYNEGTKANVPTFIRVRMMNDYVDKQFGGDVIMKKKTQLIGQLDPLCTYSVVERQAMLGSAVGKRAWQFSVELPGIMDSLIRDKGKEWLLRSPYDAVKAEVDVLFSLIAEVPAEASVAGLKAT